MLPSYHMGTALAIPEIHHFLWISTSGAVFLDQAVLPEPNGTSRRVASPHWRQAFPMCVAIVCALTPSLRRSA